jgi:hypothetical protein
VNNTGEILLQHKAEDGASIKLEATGKIILTSKNKKNTFTLEDEKISVVNEKFSLIIDVSGNKISIVSEQDLELTAKNGKLTLSGQEVGIESKGAMKLKGSTIDLN